MNNRIAINKKVNVTAVYFQGNLKTFPKRIECDGDTYTFLESGMQYLIKRGDETTRLFDMTDGHATYRLKSDANQFDWTLVAITPNA